MPDRAVYFCSVSSETKGQHFNVIVMSGRSGHSGTSRTQYVSVTVVCLACLRNQGDSISGLVLYVFDRSGASQGHHVNISVGRI